LKKIGIISFLGKYSLPIYFIHTLLIKFYIPFFFQSFENYNVLIFLSGILSLYMVIFFYIYLINLLRDTIKKNRLVAFLLGL
jgi:peptidoglycan/LPS O-acetylase OafA/YrhL